MVTMPAKELIGCMIKSPESEPRMPVVLPTQSGKAGAYQPRLPFVTALGRPAAICRWSTDVC
ncbi:MAG: hypothetical protein JWQ58_716 [Reyranella sp.]|nr:hypothetical protein [Reyranella sp.]